jgi:uncharacterized protein (TIGR03118 family)
VRTLVSHSRAAAVVVALAAALAAVAPLQASNTNAYVVRALVSNGGVPATFTDASLVNPWGLVAGPTSPWWTANNGSNTSTLYRSDGTKVALTVGVDGGTTGTVFNGVATAFVLPGGTAAGRFIFASEDGKIRGWASGAAAVVTVDASARSAVYKGLAIAAQPDGTQRLYATDFHNGRVDVYDQSWQPIASAGAFVDPKVPKGLGPFGIQAIGGRIFVTYAKQDAAKKDDVAGQAQGWFSVFDLNGKLLSRVGPRGPLNAPWGLAIAPATFGKFGGDLLVGNFGDGHISVYTERSNGKWAYLGNLRNGAAQPLQIDGLWALEWGNGSAAGPADALYFTAGPNDEKAGLLGSITAA